MLGTAYGFEWFSLNERNNQQVNKKLTEYTTLKLSNL